MPVRAGRVGVIAKTSSIVANIMCQSLCIIIVQGTEIDPSMKSGIC